MTFIEICRAVWKEQKHIDDEDAKKTRTKYIFTEFDMNFFYKKKKRDMFLSIQQTLLENIVVFKVNHEYKMMKMHLRILK